MPSSKIRSTVMAVEIPVEIDGSDFSDVTAVEQFFNLGHIGAPSIVKADNKIFLGLSLRFHDGFRLHLIGGKRFLRKYVNVRIEPFNDKFVVIRIFSGDDDEIR